MISCHDMILLSLLNCTCASAPVAISEDDWLYADVDPDKNIRLVKCHHQITSKDNREQEQVPTKLCLFFWFA